MTNPRTYGRNGRSHGNSNSPGTDTGTGTGTGTDGRQLTAGAEPISISGPAGQRFDGVGQARATNGTGRTTRASRATRGRHEAWPPPAGHRSLALPVLGPWSVRGSAGRWRRPTLEVLEHGELLDVLVASTLAHGVLRGARRRPGQGHPGAVAWGRLCANGSPPGVAFTRGCRGRQRIPAGVTTLLGAFWLAWCPAPATGVLVADQDGTPIRLRAGVAA